MYDPEIAEDQFSSVLRILLKPPRRWLRQVLAANGAGRVKTISRRSPDEATKRARHNRPRRPHLQEPGFPVHELSEHSARIA